MRRHWFFDFDGTLCDTEADIKRAWRAALRELGRDCPQFDAVYRTGPTLDQVTYMLFDDATPELVEQIRARFKTCYDQGGFPETKPYPWVPAWLAALKAKIDANPDCVTEVRPRILKIGIPGLYNVNAWWDQEAKRKERAR